MTVKDLKNLLEEYSDNAEVIGIKWSTGNEFNVTIGGDDEDEYTKFCRIGID